MSCSTASTRFNSIAKDQNFEKYFSDENVRITSNEMIIVEKRRRRERIEVQKSV